jgi:aminomethyltransferase
VSDLKKLGLHDLHLSLGGKMVPFAGYEMPVQYPLGVMKEHLHTRTSAGLFDVSHMGQAVVKTNSDWAAIALALETVLPVDVLGLKDGRQRYGLITNAAGGTLDDLMFARRGEDLFIVVNAACKEQDFAIFAEVFKDVGELQIIEDRALLALQGPKAEVALSRLVPAAADMKFMDQGKFDSLFGELWISRSGYSGEDGYEVSVPYAGAEGFARALLDMPEVEAIGLGARDSLRMEAGLPLYGHELTADISAVEAGLEFAIQKVRRTGGAREGGFAGAERILRELNEGPSRRRVGLKPVGSRAPMRDGTPLFDGATQIGVVASGTFGPSVDGPIAMALLPAKYAQIGTEIEADVRGKRMTLAVSPMPFHPTNYKR